MAYGTDGFDLTLLDPTDREPLRALVGVDAERVTAETQPTSRRLAVATWP
ncbi:DUF6817 domain-containing protein [Micromonospora echinospora]